MRFVPTPLPGVWIVEWDRQEDERGFFARSWCEAEFRAQGLNSRLVQCSVSFNLRRGTLRGMHFQRAPHAEARLVRCTRGAAYDVVLDLRPDSAAFKRWTAVELTGENGRAVYIPEGCAHGFQTRADQTELFYQMSESYHPESASGVRWNDPAFAIQWPEANAILSPRDASLPDFPC